MTIGFLAPKKTYPCQFLDQNNHFIVFYCVLGEFWAQLAQQMTPVTPRWVGSKSKNWSKVSAGTLSCAQSRLIMFKHRFRLITMGYIAENVVFLAQLAPQMTPRWVRSKYKNWSKVSEGTPSCAQSRSIVFKHRLIVIFEA